MTTRAPLTEMRIKTEAYHKNILTRTSNHPYLKRVFIRSEIPPASSIYHRKKRFSTRSTQLYTSKDKRKLLEASRSKSLLATENLNEDPFRYASRMRGVLADAWRAGQYLARDSNRLSFVAREHCCAPETRNGTVHVPPFRRTSGTI